MRTALAGALLLALFAGCPPRPEPEEPAPPPCTLDCIELPGSALDGQGRTVNRLARTFLAPDDAESPRYVFHAYLYFGAADDRSLPTRTAAAGAVLDIFHHLEPAGGGRIGNGFAALHIPVTSRDAVVAAVSGRSINALLATYDYDRAVTIGGRVAAATRTTLPRVALIGHHLPLDGAQAVDPAQLYVVCLEGLSRKDIQSRLLQLRDALQHPTHRIDQRIPTWAAKQAVSFFERMQIAQEECPGLPRQ